MEIQRRRQKIKNNANICNRSPMIPSPNLPHPPAPQILHYHEPPKLMHDSPMTHLACSMPLPTPPPKETSKSRN